MDTETAILTRKTVRKFTEQVPPEEDVKKIINAARVAPSSSNGQMWHFKVIYNADMKQKLKQAISNKYDEILSWHEAKGNEPKIKFYKEYSTFFTDAPVNIAVLMEYKTSVIEEIYRKKGVPEEEIQRCRPNPNLQSVGGAIENLLLMAHEMGYGACWLTAPLYAYKELEEILETKEPYQLVAFVCLGSPAIPEQKAVPKKELNEVISFVY